MDAFELSRWPVVHFENVGIRYGTGAEVLRDLTFSIEPNSFQFLTGPSGAGKTTLLRLILLAVRPTRGLISLFGQDVAGIASETLTGVRRRMGVVFQDFRLLRDRTAEENVAFALEVTGTKRTAITPRVNRLLTQVGLAHKARAFPDELSGGERQRVAVARALANEPLVLLADEPTGNLDEWAAKGVFELFREINSMGMTILMATHDLALVRAHPEYRVVELAQGAVVYDSAAAAVEAGRG